MKSLAIYHKDLSGGGGVTTFTKNLIKNLHKHYRITLYFEKIKAYQIKELMPFCEFSNETTFIDSDYLISSQNHNQIPRTNAKKIIKIVHADFSKSNNNYNHDRRITHIVAVSQHNKKMFEQLYEHKVSKVIPNLPDPTKPNYPKKKNKTLKLITVSRIVKGKGFDRMIDLAKLMGNEGISFNWDVYGKPNKHILPTILKTGLFNYKGYTRNPAKHIAKADYLVQLSDSEGMPYSVIEALQQLTPAIVTNFPSAKELITDGNNGYILDMDLSNWKKIFDNQIKITNFEPISNPGDWVKLLENGN